jgi:hypothetical protein
MLADDQRVELQSSREILIYKDFSNPSLFYYVSTQPAIAKSNNQFQYALTHYDKPVKGMAGMLSLVVNLQPDQASLDKVRQELQAQSAQGPIQLVPMPWTSGSVSAAVIGCPPVTATPSLLGDNFVALSIGLTTDQYIVLKSSQTPAAPISVVYSLGFEAFRPQYSFSIRFDQSKFRDWIQKQCSANLFFLNIQESETFEKLQQSGVIEVISENQTGQDPPEGFQLAFLRSLQSILVPLPHFAPAPSAGGQGNWLLGYSCSAVEDHQTLTKRLDTNMQVSGAVGRTVFIQGSLVNWKEAQTACVDIELPTDGSFIQRITVRCHSAFDQRPLDRVQVSIEPPISTGSSRVFSNGASDDWSLDLLRAPGLADGYSTRYVLYFGNNQPPLSCKAVPIAREQAFVDVVPEEYYSYCTYTVNVADTFPWSLVTSVKLMLSGPADFSFQPSQLILTKTTPTGQIVAFAPTVADLEAINFTALIYPRVGAQLSIDGSPTGSTIFLNPFESRTISFRAGGEIDWKTTNQISILVDAAAPSLQLWTTTRITLTATAPQAKITYFLNGQKAVSYRAEFRKSSGVVMRTPPIETAEAAIVVSIPDTDVQGGM